MNMKVVEIDMSKVVPASPPLKMIYIGGDNIKENYAYILEVLKQEPPEGMTFLVMTVAEFCSLLDDHLRNLRSVYVSIYIYPSDEEAKESTLLNNVKSLSDGTININLVPSLAFAIEQIGKV